MPILWNESEEKPKQELVVGNQEDDAFVYLWSRKKLPFRDIVRIRSSSMGGYNTVNTYPVLMRLAKERGIIPQIGKLKRVQITSPQEWYGICHQYSSGIHNYHLLTTKESSPGVETFGISNSTNTHVHIVRLTREHFGDTVFQILSDLSGALRMDDEQFGPWYEVLHS